ncbi:MAG: DsbA family protein [Patescibacteria group bacterium]|nr:DsbA family protein [Patescibacteria group bacterium]
MDGNRPWYRRPLPLIGLILGLVLVSALGYVGYNVAKYMSLIKSGKLPRGLSLQQMTYYSDAQDIFSKMKPSSELIALVESGDNPTLGNPKAKVRIVEFVDYDCSFCQRTAPAVREFMRKHPDDAYLILRDFPIVELHTTAKDAAVAARCAFAQSREKYWVFHDMLYENLSARSPEAYSLMARRAGLDMQEFNQCVEAKRTLPEIDKSYSHVIQAGGRGTPTFFFNGRRVDGAMDADHLEAVFLAASQLVQEN